MKNVLSFLVVSLLMGAQAWAWPQAGDMAEYQVQVTLNGQSYSGQYIMKTTAIDAAHDSLALEITTAFQGSVSTKAVHVKLSDMQQVAARVPEIVLRCAEIGGVPEILTTAAGPFATCKMANDDEKTTGFIWYADVVYGWVKQVKKERTNNQVTDVLLRAVKIGL